MEVNSMRDDDAYADLKQHRLKPETKTILEGRAFVPHEIKKRRQHFVKVPWTWVERLSDTRRLSTYRVAMHVLYIHWKRGGQPFPLSNGMLMMEGITRWSKWDALKELERLGLVRVERRRRKSPLITVIIQT
jgi:hypothetical protein